MVAEYNWWDDRTVEENDSMFCPIINDICFADSPSDCESCPHKLAFDAFIASLKPDELGPPL